MTGLTWIVNGLDLSEKISTYLVRKVPDAGEVLKSIGGTEYAFYGETQTEIEVSFFPMTEEEATAAYNAMQNGKFSVSYTDPYEGGITATRSFRNIGNLEAAFLLLSVDGKRRYSGTPVQVRTSR
jgi:hypothetical protein